MCYNRRSRPGRHGFTLMELMVVIVIMGIMATVVTVSVRGHLVTARQNLAKSDVSTVSGAVNTFYGIYGRYPTNEEGLAILTKPSEKIAEPLLEKLPVDPWGRPYQYNCPGKSSPFDVISFGEDGKEGGSGADADIRSDSLGR